MKSWMILFISLAVTWHYIDLESDHTFYSRVLPFLFLSLLIALAVKIAARTAHLSGDGSNGCSGGFDSFGDGGGGDC